jgi:hypothetical protein
VKDQMLDQGSFASATARPRTRQWKVTQWSGVDGGDHDVVDDGTNSFHTREEKPALVATWTCHCVGSQSPFEDHTSSTCDAITNVPLAGDTSEGASGVQAVGVEDGLGDGEGLAVGAGDDVGVGVEVGPTVAVSVALGVAVADGLAVADAVGEALADAEGVGVADPVGVAPGLAVGAGLT